jgi:hypothetical protein
VVGPLWQALRFKRTFCILCRLLLNEAMFVGHYGVAFAAKTERNRIPLWVLFIVVQFLDYIWATLVLLGIEKLKGWRRSRKIVLIEQTNPRWLDLSDDWEQQPKVYDRPWVTEEMI